MLALQTAMAFVVATYYCWPAGASLLARYATWQHSGGILAAAVATALAGGVLSELSRVYIQDKGRWTLTHVDNMVFNMVLFFICGGLVYEFYRWQAVWFGEGATWSVLVPKILVDQFIYSVVVATPLYTFAPRWHELRYSGTKLWQELDINFVTDRMLPVLVTNWMFWLPGVTLIYSMPSILQTPLFIFATAIWGLLLPAVTRQGASHAIETVPPCIGPELFADPAEQD